MSKKKFEEGVGDFGMDSEIKTSKEEVPSFKVEQQNIGSK